MTRRFTAGLLVCVLLPSAAVWAQSPAMGEGSRVRVRPVCDAPTCAPVVGRLLASPGDSLLLQDDHGTTRQVALASGTRVERSTGYRRYTLAGLGLGTLVGLGTGAALVEDCHGAVSSSSDSDDICKVFYLTVPAGAALGALIGALIRTERWEPIPTPGPALHVSALPGRATVAVSMDF